MEVFAGRRRIKDVRLGRNRPVALYLGDMKIWPNKELYIEVKPDVLWLTLSNNFSSQFSVESNTVWVIE